MNAKGSRAVSAIPSQMTRMGSIGLTRRRGGPAATGSSFSWAGLIPGSGRGTSSLAC